MYGQNSETDLPKNEEKTGQSSTAPDQSDKSQAAERKVPDFKTMDEEEIEDYLYGTNKNDEPKSPSNSRLDEKTVQDKEKKKV